MEDNPDITVIIPAAGGGERFGGPKLFSLLGGCPLILYPLHTLSCLSTVTNVIIATNPLHSSQWDSLRANLPPNITITFTHGGPTRRASVSNALRCATGDIVLIHDGARPLASADLFLSVARAAKETGAAMPVLPITDTVRRICEGQAPHPIDRTNLFRIQTPQGFHTAIIKRLMEQTDEDTTDDAALFIERGFTVATVLGDERNIKITRPADLAFAELLLKKSPSR